MKRSLFRRFAALACSLHLVSGCASVPQPKPFTGDRETAPIKGLSVAVLMPKVLDLKYNDKNLKELTASDAAMQRAIGVTKISSGFRLLVNSIYDPEKLYRSLLSVYYQDFKNVIVVESVDDPRAAEADLIAVPRVAYNVYPPSIGAVIFATLVPYAIGVFITPIRTAVDSSMETVFYAPDRSQVAMVKAKTPRISKWRPIVALPKLDLLYADLNAHLANNLDTALETSPELIQYAKTRTAALLAASKPARQEAAPAKRIVSDADQPGYHFPEDASKYAVVVGVESYQNLKASEFSRRDAEAVKAHLRALGYPAQNIVLMTDAQATGTKLRSYLESWLPRNVKQDSQVVFYFSGFGAPDADTQQAYLLPWDGDPQFLADTGYSLKRLYENLGALPAKKVIVVFDAGFSGTGGRSVIAKGARPLVLQAAMDSDKLGKAAVLSAAGGEETAGLETSQGHGLFTYHLLKGLNESGGDGALGKLMEYVRPKVGQAARAAGRGQTPSLAGELPADLK